MSVHAENPWKPRGDSERVRKDRSIAVRLGRSIAAVTDRGQRDGEVVREPLTLARQREKK